MNKARCDQITQEVRQAARDYATARAQVNVTESRIASEQANLEVELARLQVGLSTTFRVLQFQKDLANAQLSHIQAVIDTNTAAIALEKARGTFLETYGVHPVDTDK
jgi:outer membrane protein TolC